MKHYSHYFFPFNIQSIKRCSEIKQLDAAKMMLEAGTYFNAQQLAELIHVEPQAANRFLWNIYRGKRYEIQQDKTHKSLRFMLTAINSADQAVKIKSKTVKVKAVAKPLKTNQPTTNTTHKQSSLSIAARKPVATPRSAITGINVDRLPLWKNASLAVARETAYSVRRVAA
jgi:hypothetical protein